MMGIQVQLGLREPEVQQDPWVCPDLKALVVIQGKQERRDHQVVQDKEDLMGKMVKKDQQELQDLLVYQGREENRDLLD